MKRSSLTISLKLKLYTEKMKRKCYFPEEEGEKINYIFIPCALTWRGKRVMVEQVSTRKSAQHISGQGTFIIYIYISLLA